MADRIAPGFDPNDPAVDLNGDLADADHVEVEQGLCVRISRVATRYRVEGDALLIVQGTNGGML